MTAAGQTSRWALYQAAARVGRVHVASAANTVHRARVRRVRPAVAVGHRFGQWAGG
jgi:hypothetical protein